MAKKTRVEDIDTSFIINSFREDDYSIPPHARSLEGDTKVIPGHGPCSEIATERMTNPFLMPFNEPYEE